MINIVVKILLLLITYSFLYLISASISEKKLRLNYIDVIILVIVTSLNAVASISNESLLKGLVTFLGFIVFSLRRSKSLKNAIVTGFVVYVYAIIADVLSAIIVSICGFTDFMTKASNLSNIKLGYSSILGLIMLFIININIIKRFLKSICENLYNSKITLKLIVLIFALFEASIIISLTHTSGLKENILSYMLMFGMGIGVYMLIYNVTKRNELKLINKNLLLNNESYLKIINNYKLFKHNFKYELNAISNVGNKKVKDMVKSYIDEYEETSFDNSDIIKLPNTIKSLVYQKLLESGEISCNVIVDNFLNNDPFEFLTIKKLCTLSQCIGIILDNAIEEAVRSKDKYIYLKLCEDSNHEIIFECHNEISSELNIDNIGIEGNSTKKDHMGVGTSYLAKQKLFDITNLIKNDMYIVKVKISI